VDGAYKKGGQVIKQRLIKSSALGGFSLSIIALLNTPAPGFWLGAEQAQGQVFQAQRRRLQERPIVRRNSPNPRRPLQSSPIHPPAIGPLATALASCDKEQQSKGPFVLPGAKGDITLDGCYRGRDHLNCTFDALTTEAKALLEGYGNVIEARYTDVKNVDGICGIKPDKLGLDRKNALDFSNRFKVFKTYYKERTSCTSKIAESLNKVTLRDIPQSPEILKSMTDAFLGEVKDVSDVQAEVAELAEKIDSASKAMTAINLVHHAMCPKDEGVPARQKDQHVGGADMGSDGDKTVAMEKRKQNQ
jgi:hypothetical protein